MFKFFVTGPLGTNGLGLARRCVLCRARPGTHAATCTGFGDGCLTQRLVDADDETQDAKDAGKPAAPKK